jgi:hypothetical protein
MHLQGNNLIIYVDGVAVAAAKSCTVTMEVGSIDTAGSGRTKASMPTVKDWSVKTSVLVTSLNGHFALSGKVRLSVAVVDGGEITTDRMTGEAIVTSANVSAAVGNLVQGSFSFKGTGALERPRVRLRDNQGTPLNDSQGIHLYAIGQI